jgi:cytochrome b subunit of formate dehydrogenase
MKWLLLGVFGFFGIHTLLWFQRSVVDFIRNHKKQEDTNGKQWVLRFKSVHRLTHILIVVSFIVLAATGLPLMFYYTGWAGWLEGRLGGVELSRFLHRVAAVITFGYGAIHLWWLIKTAVIKRQWRWLYGPESMVPRVEDIKNVFQMFRWFFYLGPRPKLDRWTYWEKFDYFAVFWGIPVIGLSGLILWFPKFFTLFLPGVALNLATIIHSEEALLATGFIFAFHFFHNHLRPENFPMDISVFTGKVPLERFKEERPAEYQRLVDEDKLNDVLTDPPTRTTRLWSNIFGATAYIIGLFLVVAIFYTLLRYKL